MTPKIKYFFAFRLFIIMEFVKRHVERVFDWTMVVCRENMVIDFGRIETIVKKTCTSPPPEVTEMAITERLAASAALHPNGATLMQAWNSSLPVAGHVATSPRPRADRLPGDELEFVEYPYIDQEQARRNRRTSM